MAENGTGCKHSKGGSTGWRRKIMVRCSEIGGEDIKTRCSSRRLPSRSWTKAGQEARIKWGVQNAECGIKSEARDLGRYKVSKRFRPNPACAWRGLAFTDPFTKKRVEIHAPVENFLKEFGFSAQS